MNMKCQSLPLIFALLVVALLIPCKLQAQKKTATTQQKLEHFLKVSEEVRARLKVPGAGIGIVFENKVIYTGGLGYRDVGKKLPVTENTLFAIGSNTKAFTGFLVTRLASQKKLDWNQPITELIPDFELKDPYVAKHATLADACSHMTGISRKDDLWKGKSLTRQQIYEQVKTLDFDFSLRKTFHYNNHMYLVVGKAIESVSGNSWDDEIREKIFQPLGMINSFTTYREFMNHPERSTGYGVDGTTPMPHLNIDNIAPAGSISSTPKDYVKWLQTWVNKGEFEGKPFLTKEEYKQYSYPQSCSRKPKGEFGFYWAGWGGNIADGKTDIGHSGGIDGQNAFIVVKPDDGFGIFVLTNQRSDYKYLIVDYANKIFLEDNFSRDKKREDELAAVVKFVEFKKTLMNDGIESAKKFHKTIPLKHFENQMNRLGYDLLEKKDLDKALFVFKTNVADNPKASNPYDSLGECYFLRKELPLALKNYQKSLSLDPKNGNAKTMISRIQKMLKKEP